VGVIAAGAWTVVTYIGDQQTKTNQAANALVLRGRELDLELFRDKREAYLALIDSASTIAACADYDEVKVASKDFLKIYYGRAHSFVTGDEDVFSKKVDFKRALDSYLINHTENTPADHFGDPSLGIALACRFHLDPRCQK